MVFLECAESIGLTATICPLERDRETERERPRAPNVPHNLPRKSHVYALLHTTTGFNTFSFPRLSLYLILCTLRHLKLSSTCTNSSQTVTTPTRSSNRNSTLSTCICQPELHFVHMRKQTVPSWESHWRIPSLNLCHRWCMFHPEAPILTSFHFCGFLICVCLSVKARRHAGNVIVLQSESPRSINIDSGGCCCWFGLFSPEGL